MGQRNYLIEGVSCSGKTTICNELCERGYHAINGDTELAYQGDPATGEPVGTVKWRISRAYERLRRILSPEMGPETEKAERHESVRSTSPLPGRRDEAPGPMAHAAASPGVPRL